MTLLGIDLGGTKLAFAVLREDGEVLYKETVALDGREGTAVGDLITGLITRSVGSGTYGPIASIGISVPGIYRHATGNVWAPNIPGWEDYPLLARVSRAAGPVSVAIDSDRACYIMGECWQGNARQSKDAIFIAVGTGIGAGILTDGNILRGAHDIAGAIGWMALHPAFKEAYKQCGCFEEYASGEGITKTARRYLKDDPAYKGQLRAKPAGEIFTHDVFAAYLNGDPIAAKVIGESILLWGMAAANLISLFNPEKLIWGGGVFGPAIPLIPEIRKEAAKWAQPVSMKQVQFESSGLGSDAGLFGAAYLALKKANT